MDEVALDDPLDISKEPELIKEAQKDLSKIDVFVCGGCHQVFHFIEEFQSHKDECSNVSVLKCEYEEKTQIWGFTLWKCKQIKTSRSKGEALQSSWDIYQTWTKLDPSIKDLWVTAGKALQFISKVSTGKINEIKKDKDPLALDDESTTKNETSKTAVRSSKENEEEYNVEKILGKRFNPRRRVWEYEVKWENYSEHTWEPPAHLENCKKLVQEYEDKLKAEKEQKEKDKPPSRGRGRPRLNPQSPGAVKIVKKPTTPPNTIILTTPGTRPQRTSKQKALNQVKAWCGNISDEEGGGSKRPYDDDGESDDSFEKKFKLEGESEDTEEDEPKTPAKKVAKILHTFNNGSGKKLPDNVLIPDAKGVVRISQKQLPSLSSGVYIMSKSSGIIKLDPTASKIATSGGQAIVKVSPKIGQTQIKIIKKNDGTKRVIQVKGSEQSQTTTLTPKPRILQQIVAKTPIVKKEVKKSAEPVKSVPIKVEKKDEVKYSIQKDDDSDDGLPELEFPKDLPIPEPESPPGEFILDPITGKVAGVEYPEPEPQPALNEEKKDENPSQNLDNIVQLAAADITEEDLKSDSEPVNNSVTTASSTISVATTVTNATVASATLIASAAPKTTQSILNTAMANSNILQKTLQSPKPTKTQPRIINQSVARPRTTIGPIVKTPNQSRAVITPIRPKPQILPKPRIISAANPIRNVYSAKTNNVVKKIGNTTISTKPKQVTPASQLKKSPQKPKASISMPTLDEDPVVLAPKMVSDVPTVETDLSTFTLASSDRPMFITGDDGTVYQVAGQNEEGQTILVTQDSDGQQQCLLVTGEALQEEVEQVGNPAEVLMEVQEPVEVAEEQPLVAQFIRTEPPSPGGTHKVVVMLPDGDMMMTQVTAEEYASLELDK